MGEIAEMMLDGTLDCETGEFLGSDAGFPVTADDCARLGLTYGFPDERCGRKQPKRNKACPFCAKAFRTADAALNHIRDKHT